MVGTYNGDKDAEHKIYISTFKLTKRISMEHRFYFKTRQHYIADHDITDSRVEHK